jgi:hypothetical protein
MATKEEVMAALRNCYDPETPLPHPYQGQLRAEHRHHYHRTKEPT